MSDLEDEAGTVSALTALLDAPGGGGARRRYAVLPSRSRPRYVVPVGRRHAGAVHVRPAVGVKGAARRQVVRAALRFGAGRLMPGGLEVADGSATDPGLRRHLADLLDRDDVDVALAIGQPRANRKPVVQVIDGRGATVAWAKIGVDRRTDELVARETEALAAVADRPGLVVPSVVATGTWGGHRLLVLAPIVTDESADDLDPTAEVVRAIAGPTSDHEPTETAWWHDLRRASETCPGLVTRLDRLEPALEGRRWPFGRWHGDLAPWNACWVDGRLAVWDWERSTTGMPLGFDLIHNRVQVDVLRRGVPIGDALAAAASRERPVLGELGYRAEDALLLAAAYGATLRARYAVDAEQGPLGAAAPLAVALDATATEDRR